MPSIWIPTMPMRMRGWHRHACARSPGFHWMMPMSARRAKLARRDAATASRLASDLAEAQQANAAWLAGIAHDQPGAVDALRRALALRPHDADLLSMLAVRQIGFGQLDQAVESLRAALKTNPLSAPTLYSLGACI